MFVVLSCALPVTSCVQEDWSFASDLPGAEPFDHAAFRSTESDVRILEPEDGEVLKSPEFTVRVVQELRFAPDQGRGLLQYSEKNGAWRRLGGEFPWSRQPHEFSVPAVLQEAGAYYLRVIVYEVDPSAPFLVSPPVQIEAWGGGRQRTTQLHIDSR
jgi:hypothetical protein